MKQDGNSRSPAILQKYKIIIMNIVSIIGRIIFGGYFLMQGIFHFSSHAGLTAYAASKGVPAPSLAIYFTGLMLIVGGIGLIAGKMPKISAALIAVFLFFVSLKMHNFWAISDPASKIVEMGNFTKNMALLGGSLVLMNIKNWSYSAMSKSQE